MSKDKRKNHHRVESPRDLRFDREAMDDLLLAWRFPVAILPPESVVRIINNGDSDDDSKE